MRTRTISRWRKAVLGTAAAAGLVAGARAQEAQQQPEAAPAPAAETGKLAAPAPEGGETQTYTIQKGDTLWDLSQKFLNNPWYWPKIWSLNPYIENPHWIYPGNKLKVLGGQGGAPAQVEAAAQPPGAEPGAIPASAAVDPNAAPPEGVAEAAPDAAADDPLSPVAPVDPSSISVTDLDRVQADKVVSTGGRLAFTPPSVLTTRTGNLVSDQEYDASGTLDASFEEKAMLATYDTAYVNYKQAGAARVGDKVLIYRPGSEILHPGTGRALGRRTLTVAEAKVVAAAGSGVTVQIGRTWMEIERGDRVRPWSETTHRIAPRPNTKQVAATIVSSVIGDTQTWGNSAEVFLDKGRNDGVEEGNTFLVLRKGDGLAHGITTEESVTYTGGEAGEAAGRMEQPDESVGLLMVVEARDNISTAVVVRAVRELAVGERVEMRPGGSGGD